MQKLCALAELADCQARAFTLNHNGSVQPIFIVRDGDHWYAYRNSCPHTGVNLDWVKHQFLDLDGAHIQCATHGALFRKQDGYCIFGPCRGESLLPLPLRVQDDSLYLDITAESAPVEAD